MSPASLVTSAWLSCSKLGNPRHPSPAKPRRGLLPLDHPCLPNQVEESGGGRSGRSGRSGYWWPKKLPAKAARWFATRMEKSGLKANAAKLRIGCWGKRVWTCLKQFFKTTWSKLFWTLVRSIGCHFYACPASWRSPLRYPSGLLILLHLMFLSST